jgi:hypothetical protein
VYVNFINPNNDEVFIVEKVQKFIKLKVKVSKKRGELDFLKNAFRLCQLHEFVYFW